MELISLNRKTLSRFEVRWSRRYVSKSTRDQSKTAWQPGFLGTRVLWSSA